ncbi:MAG: VIT1/CCC1 transporter family protein [Phycisphaerales bacterium]|nr:VIT1/CCC1 transporter family protein [Phycisphaerales bacterium]
MPAIATIESKRLLDPISRISEILFGLIMALTFTGSLSAATAGREEVRTMLFGAIGCNIAWGLVDAIMFLVTRLTERGIALSKLRSVLGELDSDGANAALAGELPPMVAAVLSPAELASIRERLKGLPELPRRPRLLREDWLGSIGVFLLVVIATFPVVVPFILMTQTVPAMRVSNLIAVIMLFLCGYRLGDFAGHRPWWMGFSMAVIGSILVGLTIALGG